MEDEYRTPRAEVSDTLFQSKLAYLSGYVKSTEGGAMDNGYTKKLRELVAELKEMYYAKI